VSVLVVLSRLFDGVIQSACVLGYNVLAAFFNGLLTADFLCEIQGNARRGRAA